MPSPRRLATLIKSAVPLLKRQLLVETVDAIPIAGEVPVIEITFPGSERLPIYVTDTGSQLLCISYLWRDDEVKPRLRAKLMETLLDLNPAVPLSSFGRIGAHFVLVGALSPAASPADMALELATLGDNGRDALTTLAEFLV